MKKLTIKFTCTKVTERTGGPKVALMLSSMNKEDTTNGSVTLIIPPKSKDDDLFEEGREYDIDITKLAKAKK